MKYWLKKAKSFFNQNSSAVFLTVFISFYCAVIMEGQADLLTYILLSLGLVLAIIRQKQRTDIKSPFTAWLVGALIFLLVFWSFVRYKTWFYGYAWGYLPIPFALVLAQSLDHQEKQVLKYLLTYVGVLFAVLGILEFSMVSFAHSDIRVSGVIGNANMFGIFLVINWLLLNEKDWKSKMKYDYSFFVLACLFLTLSIGSIICLFVAFIALFWKKGKKQTAVETVMLLLGLAGGALFWMSGGTVLLYPLFLLPFACGLYSENIREIISKHIYISCGTCLLGLIAVLGYIAFSRTNAGATFIERLQMYQDAVDLIIKKPLSGYGQLSWHAMDISHLLASQRGEPYYAIMVHNFFLHLWLEGGIIPALIGAWIFAESFRISSEKIMWLICLVFLIQCSYDCGFFSLGLLSFFLVLIHCQNIDLSHRSKDKHQQSLKSIESF